MSKPLSRRLFSAGSLLLGAATPARSQGSLTKAHGDVLLTVSGQVTACNNLDGDACFDKKMLQALGPTEMLTTCPWFDGRIHFEGVRVDRLLQAVGAEGEHIVVVGRGGEQATLPLADISRYGVLLAYSLNKVSVRTTYMGPLFVVYPFDDVPELNQPRFYSRTLFDANKLIVS